MNNSKKIQKQTNNDYFVKDQENREKTKEVSQKNLLEKLTFLKLMSEKQSKQIKQHRLEQENLNSLFTKKNEEFLNLLTHFR